jgi:hypothetical protein
MEKHIVVDVDVPTWRKFKANCVIEGVSIADKTKQFILNNIEREATELESISSKPARQSNR